MGEDKKRIMFVDDEPNLLEGLRRSLGRMRKRWNMAFAVGGEEALDLLATEEFDAIVTDMRMPGMNGAQLLERVAKLHPHMARFVLSGQSDEDTVLTAVKHAHQFLSKPCDTDLLKKSLSTAVGMLSLIPDRKMRSLVTRSNVIPVLPEILDEFRAELGGGYPDLQKVVSIVSSDTGLTVRMLQLVSSSFFGFYPDVSSAKEAVEILGTEVLAKLVEDEDMFVPWEEEIAKRHSIREMTERSIKASRIAAEAAASTLGKKDAAYAVLMARFHDIGKLFLIANYGGEDQAGITGRWLGSCLLGLWGLNGNVLSVIGCGDDPDPEAKRGCTKQIFEVYRSAMEANEMIEA